MQVWSLISLHERHMNCAIARRDQAELLSRVQKPHNLTMGPKTLQIRIHIC